MVAMRRLLTATILALAAFGLLLAGTGAAHAQDEAGGLDGTFGVAPSRPGDRALYTLHLVRMDDAKQGGGWAYDAGATLEVKREGDRVLPVGGVPIVASSFASTWTIEPVDWSGWAMEWDMARFEAEMEAMAESMEGSEDQEEEDWEDWGDGGDWEGAAGAWSGSVAAVLQGLFADWQSIQGEPWHVAHIDPGHRVVATTRAGTDPALPGNRLAADLGLQPQTSVLTTFGPSSAPCGFHSDLQGAVVPLAQEVRVHGNCPPAGGHFGTAPGNLTSDRYVAVGHDLVQGRPAIVFAHEAGASNLRLWYTEDTPYPVRMVVPVQLHDGYEVYLLYEMTRFQPGSEQDTRAPDALGLAPRARTGPEEAGLTHPFPLSAALQAALTDLEHRDVAEWMAAHPDAAVDEARFLHLRDDDGLEQEQWRFTLVGDGDALHVTATKGAPYEAPVGEAARFLPPEIRVPPGTLPPQVDNGVKVASHAGGSGGRISHPQLPADLPKVADLLALWQADGAGGGTPAWAFELRPDGSSWVAAGQAEAYTTGGGTAEDDAETTLSYAFYGVGPDGSFRFVEESPARYDVPAQEDPDALGSGYDPEEDDAWTRPSTFAIASIGYWEFPEAKTTATVGAAAGLVGLLAYALLPAKYGALGLFSRIGNDQVLEHPLRQQIADLVAAEPGIHFQELVRRLDAGRGTMEHHLRKLVAADVLTMQVSQGFTCFFPKGKVDRHLMAAAPVLKSEGARQVLQAIQERPGRAALDVAAAIGLTPSTVNYHLKRLAASGLVAHERRGRFILLTATPLGTQALGAWGRT